MSDLTAKLLGRLVFGEVPPLDLLRSVLRHKTYRVAFDTTKLQSADSFLSPIRGRGDARGDGEFKQVADAFCNGADLLVPLPFTEQGVSPRLLEAWPNATRVVNLEFDPIADSDAESELHKAFRDAMAQGRAAQDAATWISFQFTPEMGRQYESRGADEPIRRVAPAAAEMLDAGQLPALEYELQRLESTGALMLPDAFWNRFSTYEVRDAIHLAVSYALSIFLRGWSYAAPFEITGDYAALYNPTWVRSMALRARNRLVRGRSQSIEVPVFPWGTILLGAMQGQRPALPRDVERVIDVMLAIRTDGPTLLDHLGSLPADKLCSSEASLSLSDGEEVLLNFVGQKGVFPRLKDVPGTRLAQYAGLLPKPYGDAVPSPELITLVVDSGPGSVLSAGLEKTFKRDTFWDGFELPGAREALRIWRRETSRQNAQLQRG